MGFFDKLEKSKGGYIFLSHSHADIKIIRKIRNSLEEDGFEPLCFYLKCLDDNDEIEDLIKREIDAREWFIFANSENARKSKWVTLEREYIEKTGRKKIITIDIDDPTSIDTALDHILHNLRVYIAHSSEEALLAHRIQSALEEKDYLVFSSSNDIATTIPLDNGFEWRAVSLNALELASREGCVIALITQNSIKPGWGWVREEVLHALHAGGNIIPIVIGNIKFDNLLEEELRFRRWYPLSNNPTDDEIYKLVDTIGQFILSKAVNNTAR